jgi:hypothetical protein
MAILASIITALILLTSPVVNSHAVLVSPIPWNTNPSTTGRLSIRKCQIIEDDQIGTIAEPVVVNSPAIHFPTNKVLNHSAMVEEVTLLELQEE